MALRFPAKVWGLLALVAGLTLTGCGLPPRPGTTHLPPTPVGLVAGMDHPARDMDPSGLGKEQPVFIVSSRALADHPRGVDPFDNTRNKGPLPHLAVGYVSVGANVSPAELKRETFEETRKKAARIKLERVELSPRPDIEEHWLVKRNAKEHQNDPWIKALRAELDQSRDRTLTIFVHGYNTDLVTNTENAAAIMHYLGRGRGAIISFEWPSEGRLTKYAADKGNASQSTRMFRALLSIIARETDCSRITILAHSAGNPIVVEAMRDLRLLEYNLTAEELRAKYRIGQVILAAPDMDLMIFFNAVFDRFYEVANAVGVYTNPKDKALNFSSRIFDAPRLGRSVGELADWEKEVLQGLSEIEMIDVSYAESLFGGGIGHSYFKDNPWVSSDIGMFIRQYEPEDRGLQRGEGSLFWEFPTNYYGTLTALAKDRE